MTPRTLLLVAVLLVSACEGGPGAPDGGAADAPVDPADAPVVDVGMDASPDGDAAADAPDGVPPADTADGDGGAPDLVPTPLPLGREALAPVVTGPTNDYDAAAFEDDDGGLTLVVERFDPDPQRFASTLHQVAGPDPLRLGDPEPLALGEAPVVGGPHAFRLAGESFLYLMIGDPGASGLRLFRSRRGPGGFETPEPLELADTFAGNYAWPHAARLSDGRVALAYDHYGATVNVAIGDGLGFGAPVELGRGVQARVAAFAAGGMAFTFQDGQLPDTCFVRVSADGVTWTPAAPLADGSNSHDATPFTRSDGGVDLYYVYPASGRGFAVFRRAVDAAGNLGPEQAVTDPAAGSFTQPRPHRLRDGRIVLTMGEQVTSNVDTDTRVTVIAGDAPPVAR